MTLAVVGAVFLFINRSSAGPDPRESRKPYRPIPPKTRPNTGRRIGPPPRAVPFDASTALRVDSPRLIEGTARIIDGDSIVINAVQIRLFGVDAPEMNHPYGRNAKWALIGLCKGKTVRAEVIAVDRFGRTVAKCTLPDGRDLSAEMVSRGWAIDWPKFSGGAFAALEVPDARKKMWLADARQKGRMHVWERFEARQEKQ